MENINNILVCFSTGMAYFYLSFYTAGPHYCYFVVDNQRLEKPDEGKLKYVGRFGIGNGL